MLPKTFQDAIEITKRLGHHYIWIDSLCIMQDSYDDWLQEASKMQEVYANSLLNIVALGSSSSTRGCFVDRCSGAVKNRITLQWKNDHNLQYKLCRWYHWEHSIDKLDIHSRGWVFQERLLSPRLLHFGNSQVFWECFTTCACESMPSGLPDYADSKIKGLLAHVKPGIVDWRWLYEQWHTVISLYSKCEFTKCQDKLIALSGVAKVFAHAMDNTYLAGLWQKSLHLSLDWQVTHEIREPPPAYIAPSWSWASVQSPVKFWSWVSDEETQYLYKVLDAQTKSVGTQITGPFTAGHLIIECLLFGPFKLSNCERVTNVAEVEVIRAHRWIETPSGKEFNPDIWMYWDHLPYPQNETLYFMPTLYERDSFSGLILRQIGDSDSEFVRVGHVMELSEELAKEVALEREAPGEIWKDGADATRHTIRLV